ncbi:MAG: sn-glycerol-3-phosphate ABC transporter ATP-binding protein UgpC [bacterium]|nr:sn-glycerol-3-phosphate ABC transporter ATP-binding protein UgpC [bacterium]
MANVKFSQVTKRFGKVTAVQNLNLEIADKEFMTLVGPSGCGKSTTLNMLAGLEELDEGEIYIGDHLMNDVPPGDRNIAMMFQSYALYPHMKVFDNMAFALRIQKTSRPEIERRVQEAAQLLGIEDLLQRKPAQLSGGQRQRVALGRAIVRDPDVFLLDEPLSNLDAILRVQMRADLRLLFKRLGSTVVYVTHDQAEAMTMSDRLVVFNSGVIQQVGTPIEVYRQPANQFVARFIGSPPINLIHGRIEASTNGHQFVTPDFSLSLPAGIVNHDWPSEVVVGIRAEDISLRPAGMGIPAAIKLVEHLGSENIIFAMASEQMITLKSEKETIVAPDENIGLEVSPSALNFFDPTSEQRLEPAKNVSS